MVIPDVRILTVEIFGVGVWVGVGG